MPANESTWRNPSLLHRLFAVTGVLLTIATLWMFQADFTRSWKQYQAKVVNVDLKMNQWRQEQFETEAALREHATLTSAVQVAKSQAVDQALLAEFKAEVEREASRRETTVSFSSIDESNSKLAAEAKDAEAKRTAAATAAKESETAAAAAAAKPSDEALAEQAKTAADAADAAEREAAEAEAKAAETRDDLLSQLADFVNDAKIRETKQLTERKFKSANLDAARANLDIAIRDNTDQAAAQGKIDNLTNEYSQLNLEYQSLAAHRRDLDKIYKQMVAAAEQADKALADSLAGLDRLKTTYKEKEETYFVSQPPFLGKKFLTFPIIDAFMSPRRPENLWAEGLTQDYNFSKVRRFDRCTTCHGSMQKSLPGAPTSPAYVAEQTFELLLPAVSPEALPKAKLDEDGEPLPADIVDVLGIRLASEGLIDRNDATVSFVQPNSPGAKAQVLGGDAAGEKLAAEIREAALQLTGPGVVKPESYPRLPGLLVGDVITSINGSDQYSSAQRMAAALIDLAQAGKSIRIGVRRGLPNPYNSHPRLDLFVSDSSPHAMGKFACTICHEGQGSSTSFEYASHTPSTMLDMKRWQNQYGWFDNHHWIYPMNAERFAESSCLKCHHNVLELEPSDRFPEAPAPKVVHGYHLVQKYGCYGCHEINGNDGPTRRIGPDLRLEPNYFAAGQELLVKSRLPASLKTAQERQPSDAAGPNESAAAVSELIELAESIVKRPEDDSVRNRLRTLIEADAQKAPPEQLLSADTHKTAALLRDVETPGKQRKPGPSLRYFNSKLDYSFAYDWINNPRNFRPSTRMPRFFGLWNHLEGEGSAESLHKAEGIEPIEIRGTIAYLSSYSQPFEPIQRAEGMGEWSDEEKLARGKRQFETRGCLACHSHKDFPKVENFRKPNEIVQGPDLSGVGSKFEKQYNPAGPEWLYSWIKDPTRYHPRTVMPVLYLDPEQDASGKWFDPADDIAAYLLSASHIDWKPVEAAKPTKELTKEQRQSMTDLLTEYLNESFYSEQTDDYIKHGIPPSMAGSLKGAEMELIVDRKGMTADQMKSDEFQAELTDKQLRYIGKRTINKFGCFGCHDIPGFEDAKPIGTGLADWGRKDPSKLAFEHISHYIEHGHSHGGHGVTQASTAAGHASQDVGAADAGSSPVTAHPADRGTPTDAEMLADAERIEHGEADAANTDFYNHHILGGSRVGFLWQKLKEPRSYDYEKTANKKYNERLRMPQFPFDAEEREAVATFVLGLTADPPQAKYVYSPNPRLQAVQAGRQVLDKFNCAGCHILSGDKLQLTFNEGEIGPQSQSDMYPFLRPDFAPKALAASAVADRRGQYHAMAEGIPSLLKDGLPRVLDEEGAPIEGDEPYNPASVAYGFDLMRPTILGGNPYLTGQSPLTVLSRQIENRYPSQGGVLTKYLLPRVTAMELEVNPNASGAEAYSWLPPPLMGEGNKVQPGWLHDFLLEPYKIRPAAVLRMPKFNMSKDEAAKLVNYFAALDNAEYPYEMSPSRDDAQLARRATAYGGEETARFDDAMRIVVDNNYCVKCHYVGDFRPPGSPRALAPNLAEVYGRLRPDYLRDWIANPKAILPYTPMPVNIPYKPMEPHLGGVSQELYHGTSVEQVEGLVDLLMNFDRYTRGQTKIADRVKPPAAPMPAADGEAPPQATEPPAGDSAASGTN